MEADFSAFSNAIDTIIQGVDAAMMSSEFAAPVSVTGGYTITFGSYKFEIVGGTLPEELIIEHISVSQPEPIAFGVQGEPIYSYDANGDPVYEPTFSVEAIVGSLSLPMDFDQDGNPIYGYDPNGDPIYDPTSEYSSSSSSSSPSSHDYAYEDSWSFDQGVTGMIVYESDVENLGLRLTVVFLT